MVIAKWDPNERMAVVEVCKGTHLDTMGIRGRVDLLYPEEAVFLVEKSRMCLFLPNSSEPASLEECMVLMLENGISLENYLVYSHLKSLGNIVFRHGAIGSLTSDSPIKFTFDVWLPRKSGETKWSRKNASFPSFYLLVLSNSPTSSTKVDGEMDFIVQKMSETKATLKSDVKIASCTASGLIDFFDLQLNWLVEIVI